VRGGGGKPQRAGDWN